MPGTAMIVPFQHEKMVDQAQIKRGISRLMKKKPKITALQDILGTVLGDMDMGPKAEYVMIHRIWNSAVGSGIAENTCPVSIRNGILFVTVSNSVWMHQLHFLKDKILEKVNSELGSSTLGDIRFKIGNVTPLPTPNHSDPLPELDKREKEKIRREASLIDDPELCESFRRVMEAYFRNKKEP